MLAHCQRKRLHGDSICDRKTITPEKRLEIINLLKVTSNAKYVANLVGGTSHQTVWRIAKIAGIELTAGKAAQKLHRVAPAKRLQIINLLKFNSNAKQVAHQLSGVSHTTVRSIAKEAGIELAAGKAARGRHRVTPAKRAQIINALRENPNSTRVAREIGNVGVATVWLIAKAAGIELSAGKAARGHRSTRAVFGPVKPLTDAELEYDAHAG